MDETLTILADRIRAARRLTILTGAGISAASGVPTFRGQDGLWRQYRPEDLAIPEAFERNPRLVWEWYDWRRGKIAGCRPNAGHQVIAAWSETRPECSVVTQNVDDLHVRAGTRNLTRLHGSIWELTCWDRCAKGAAAWRDERVPLGELPARCPQCGGLARPAVVWFGEALRGDDLRAALESTACDVFLTVGTSAIVYPAAGLVHDARRQGAFTAEINLEETPASGAVDVAIHGGAEVILPRLDELL
ncbi:MAG: NAD-dependent deacylase [Acidobacteria bacterium]|nr:NAD-dependent deacylase [Acidobacteriota bacterium]